MTVDVPGERFPSLNYDNKSIIRRDQQSSRKQDCPWLEGTVLGLYNKKPSNAAQKQSAADLKWSGEAAVLWKAKQCLALVF